MKRILSCLVAVVLLLGMMPTIGTFAEMAWPEQFETVTIQGKDYIYYGEVTDVLTFQSGYESHIRKAGDGYVLWDNDTKTAVLHNATLTDLVDSYSLMVELITLKGEITLRLEGKNKLEVVDPAGKVTGILMESDDGANETFRITGDGTLEMLIYCREPDYTQQKCIGIECEGNLEIDAEVDVTVITEDVENTTAISCTQNILITAPVSASVSGAGEELQGIMAWEAFEIRDAEVQVEVNAQGQTNYIYGLYSYDALKISGSELDCSVGGINDAYAYGIQSNMGDIEIKSSQIRSEINMGSGYICSIGSGGKLQATESFIKGTGTLHSVSDLTANYIDFIDCRGDVVLDKSMVSATLDAPVNAYGLYVDQKLSAKDSAVQVLYEETDALENVAVYGGTIDFEGCYWKLDGGYAVANGYYDAAKGQLPASITLKNMVAMSPQLIKPKEYYGEMVLSDGEEKLDTLRMAPKQYGDVAINAWYAPSAEFTDALGIFEGTGNGKFSPTMQMNRAMMMVALARMNGVDTTPAAGESWYKKGVAWAMKTGVSDGTNPNNPITREQLACMIWNLEGKPQIENGDYFLQGFTDGTTTSGWAKDGLAWAVSEGIIRGKDGNRLDPLATATRAEVAQLMVNYLTI